MYPLINRSQPTQRRETTRALLVALVFSLAAVGASAESDGDQIGIGEGDEDREGQLETTKDQDDAPRRGQRSHGPSSMGPRRRTRWLVVATH